MKKKIILLTLILISTILWSQNKPLDSVIIDKISKIKPSFKKYIQYVENSNGLIYFNSLLKREIQEANYNGKKAYLIIQKYQKTDGVDLDSSYVDAFNLMPLSYRTDIETGKYKEHVEFSKIQIKNHIIYNDSISTSIKRNNNYHNGVIINDLIGELSLDFEKTYELYLVNPGKRYREYKVTVKVLGVETLKIGLDVKIPCWKLKVNYGAPNIYNTEWFSVGDQIQIKSEFNMKNGSKFIRTMMI